MTRSIFRLGAVALVAVLAIAGLALAAKPKAGTWSASLGKTFQPSEGQGMFKITKTAVIKHSKGLPEIVAPSNFQCNSSNLYLVKNKIKVRSGKFKYVGKAYVNYGDPSNPVYQGDLTWKGKFTTKKKVKGTIHFVAPVTRKTTKKGIKYSQKTCDTGVQPWRGKLTG